LEKKGGEGERGRSRQSSFYRPVQLAWKRVTTRKTKRSPAVREDRTDSTGILQGRIRLLRESPKVRGLHSLRENTRHRAGVEVRKRKKKNQQRKKNVGREGGFSPGSEGGGSVPRVQPNIEYQLKRLAGGVVREKRNNEKKKVYRDPNHLRKKSRTPTRLKLS